MNFPFARNASRVLLLAAFLGLPLPTLAQFVPPTTTTPGAPAEQLPPQQGRRRNRNNQNNANRNNNQNNRQRTGNRSANTRNTPAKQRANNLLANLVPGGAKSSAPAFANGMAYFASWNGRVYALDVATGIKKWAFQGAGLFNASPVVGPDGTVYAACYDHNLYALEGKTGAKQWAFPTTSLLNTAPALSPQGDTVYVGGFDHVLYAVNAKTGKQTWQLKTGAVVSAPRIGPDGTVYVEADRVYAVDAQTGKALWATSPDFGAAAGIALSADGATIYAPSHGAAGQDALNALNARTGKTLWTTALPLPPSASPTVAQDRVYVVAGSLHCLACGKRAGSVAKRYGARWAGCRQRQRYVACGGRRRPEFVRAAFYEWGTALGVPNFRPRAVIPGVWAGR